MLVYMFQLIKGTLEHSVNGMYFIKWLCKNICTGSQWYYVFAGTLNGVYLSTDKGANWTFSGISSLAVGSITFDGNKVYAGTENGFTDQMIMV